MAELENFGGEVRVGPHDAGRQQCVVDALWVLERQADGDTCDFYLFYSRDTSDIVHYILQILLGAQLQAVWGQLLVAQFARRAHKRILALHGLGKRNHVPHRRCIR